MTHTPVPPPAADPPDDRRRADRRRDATRRWARTADRQFAGVLTDTDDTLHHDVQRYMGGLLTAAALTRSGRVETGPSLLLQGGTGTGKTHAAWWVIAQLVHHGVLADWEVITEEDLYARVKYRHGVDSEAVFERYANTALLGLDDLGAFEAEPWMMRILWRLINHRYAEMLPTIITTNLPADKDESDPEQKHITALPDVVDKRVVSRLWQMIGGEAVPVVGPDRRKL